MPLSPIRVPGQKAVMEIRFCSICNESIPDGEFETGRAIQAGKRSQHVACGLKRAAEMNGPRSWLTSALALYAAGVATFFLVSMLSKPDEVAKAPEVPEIVEARLTDVVQESERRQVDLIDARLDRMQARLKRTFAEETLKEWQDRVASDLQKLDDRMLGYANKVHDRMTAIDSRLSAVESRLSRLMDWFQRIQDQADQLERELAEARAQPVEQPKQPAPAEPVAQEPKKEPKNAEREAQVDKWIESLKDNNPEVVFTATIELGKLKDARAVQPLMGILKSHRELWPRLGAATSLGDLRAPDAVPTLIDALQDKEELVRSAAANALRGITEQDFDYVQGLSRAERQRIQKRYRTWWRDHEDELRKRLG